MEQISPHVLSVEPEKSHQINKEPTERSNAGVFDKVYNFFTTNPYFSAGAGLIGIGAAASVSKRLLVLLNTAFRRRFLTTLELENTDSGYAWVLDYINRQSSHKTNKLTVNTVVDQAESGKTTTSFLLLPGRGVHYFWYNYRFIKMERNRENQTVQRHGVRTPLETVTLSTYQGDANFWRNFLCEASRQALLKVDTGLVLYHAVGPEWHRFGSPRPKRPLSSIVLSEGVSRHLQTDLENFLAHERRYRNRGIPYRRGYLFYGPPGTGKTSFISAMAGHYGYSICMLSLSEPTLDDLRLIRLLNTAPKNSFVLLEDIDVAMPNTHNVTSSFQQHKAYEGASRVTPSGLLNAIDGVASAEDRLLFMTTNHMERLDPALIRPGRVDVKQFFSNCTPKMLELMFKRFYEDKELGAEICEQFVATAQDLNANFSPAQIQGHLQLYEDNPRAAIENLQNAIGC